MKTPERLAAFFVGLVMMGFLAGPGLLKVVGALGFFIALAALGLVELVLALGLLVIRFYRARRGHARSP